MSKRRIQIKSFDPSDKVLTHHYDSNPYDNLMWHMDSANRVTVYLDAKPVLVVINAHSVEDWIVEDQA